MSRNALLAIASILAFGGVGCAVSGPVSTRTLIRQQALLDFTGLLPSENLKNLKVSWAVPRDWEQVPVRRGPMYTHQQFRSPSGVTGVGVAYIRLPIPLPASTIAWLARNEYSKRYSDQKDGALLARWTDEAGREWFEAENGKYHGTGYVMTRGNEAWIVYTGWRSLFPPNAEEISISRRSAQTIVPK